MRSWCRRSRCRARPSSGCPSHERAAVMLRTDADLALAAARCCAGCKDEQRNAYVAPPPPPVTVAAPEVRTVTDYIELTGTTRPSPRCSWWRGSQGFLDQVHFQDGQRVKQGDLLFTHPAEHLPGAAAAGAVAAPVGPGPARCTPRPSSTAIPACSSRRRPRRSTSTPGAPTATRPRPACSARRRSSSWPRSISATRRSPHRSTAAWAAI